MAARLADAYPLRGVACAALALLSTSAMADLPSTIKTVHPYLMASQADFERLKEIYPIRPAGFTSAGGTISFKLTTQAVTDRALQPPVLGNYNEKANAIFVRHLNSLDTATTAALQIALQSKTQVGYIAGTVIHVALAQATQISISWNSADHSASVLAGNQPPIKLNWLKDSGGRAIDWQPDNQPFYFTSRAGETIEGLIVKNSSQQVILDRPVIDVEAHSAWGDFLRSSNDLVTKLSNCPTVAQPATTPEVCNVATGHRSTVLDSARQLALAYRMTGERVYLDTAINYADKLFAVGLNAGTEWTMGGRVGAMGYLYDWLFDDLGKTVVPNDATGRSYRAKMADVIKQTIAIVTPGKRNEDLSTAICGQQLMTDTSSVFDCVKKPVYQGWDRYAATPGPSIASNYIGGHQFSAVSQMALGLLAIANEKPEVLPLIDTAYEHFKQGFLAARAEISHDGGHQMGYSYAASGGEVGERVRMWREALNNSGGTPLFAASWQNELIYPYIYGLRNDTSFPASGDTFTLNVSAPLVANMALETAASGDTIAMAFYQQRIKPGRTTSSADVLERLLHPASGPAGDIGSLDKSRYFKRAGLVVMRDSWDYPNATLLDFKSSTFVTQNHQHLDQNSFTLNYKAPLLLDTGSYEIYGSTHWYNYYTRTIAHNSMVLFDPAERFLIDGKEHSNDGGQWFTKKAPRRSAPTYPTLEEIAPGGTNHLDGIVHYDYTEKYTYAMGNASKAYSDEKLDQDNGFLRSILFLRPDDPARQRPVAIVFDRVQALKTLPATFLLHTASDPVMAAQPSYQGNGQYDMAYAPGSARRMTVRNGDGMVTVQTLLPVNATVRKVGGKDLGQQICGQYYKSTDTKISATMPEGASYGDCRFMARQRQADNSFQWVNYAAEIKGQNSSQADVGAWRVEISPPSAPAANTPQYFLHVLHVADKDNMPASVAAADDAVRLTGDANTEALQLKNGSIIAFNRGSAPASVLSWTAGVEQARILAMGLKPETDYALAVLPSTSGFVFQLRETLTLAGSYRSSKAGLVNIRY